MDKKSTAFILGNGTSRLRFDLEKLKTLGTVYGCNAIYRDFIPDQLLAVDAKMAKEFQANKVYEKTEIWVSDSVPPDFRKNVNLLTGELKKGTGCGFTAILKALVDGFKEIYLIGFDLHPTDERPYQYFNNIYAGTDNYKGKRDCPPASGRYIPRLLNILKKNDDVQFTRAYDIETGYIPKEWLSPNITNLKHISNIDLAEELHVLVQEDTHIG